jgi:programmed cell death 6-interacting protein
LVLQFNTASSSNIGFEKASVLFNLAAIYSKLACAQPLNADGFKKAANYFQQAAGVLEFLAKSLDGWGIQGSANVQLAALAELMFANAQEAFFVKAVHGNMKSGTLAKLAIKAADFYTACLTQISDLDIFDKLWISYLKVKIEYFKGLAHYHSGLECESARKFGEQVAWLKLAQQFFKASQDSSIFKHISTTFQAEVKSISSTVELALQKSMRDNDKIYMESIPKADALSPILGAKMVNSVPIPDKDALSKVAKPFFLGLVPYKIHEMASKYTARKETFVNKQIATLNESTNIAHSTLASLKLPGSIEALEQPIGLPQNLVSRNQEIKEQGGAKYITASQSTLMSLSKTCWDLLRQV